MKKAKNFQLTGVKIIKDGGLEATYRDKSTDKGITDTLEILVKNTVNPHPDLVNKINELKEYLAKCYGMDSMVVLSQSKGLAVAHEKAFQTVHDVVKNVYNEIMKKIAITGITLTEVTESWIVKNSTLTTHMIRNSKRLELLRPEIQKILDSYPLGITAYNNSFDFGFMEDRGFRFTRKLQCPMLLSTNVCRIPNTNGYAGFKWPKVQDAYDFLFKENNYTEQHRGCDDAKHEAEIVYELYKRNIFILK